MPGSTNDDAVARQHLAARGVALARGLAAAAGHLVEFSRLKPGPHHHLGVAGEFEDVGSIVE